MRAWRQPLPPPRCSLRLPPRLLQRPPASVSLPPPSCACACACVSVVQEEALPESDEDEDEYIYNPLKLPLGWDGKPIPYWLYKLHGLNLEFKCEVRPPGSLTIVRAARGGERRTLCVVHCHRARQ